MAAFLFLPAWTFDYWQAWVFLAVFLLSALAITAYLMKEDPKLLERRLSAGPTVEKEKTQKIIMLLASMAFVATIVLPAIDHRFSWSEVPIHIVILGNILVVLGFLIIFFVFKENSFTASTIMVAEGQKVISTGPYAIVRHPMYSGGLIMLFGVPLALGSYWGLLAFVAIALVIVWRLLDEEKFLKHNLSGYIEYCQKLRYRLVPFVR